MIRGASRKGSSGPLHRGALDEGQREAGGLRGAVSSSGRSLQSRQERGGGLEEMGRGGEVSQARPRRGGSNQQPQGGNDMPGGRKARQGPLWVPDRRAGCYPIYGNSTLDLPAHK